MSRRFICIGTILAVLQIVPAEAALLPQVELQSDVRVVSSWLFLADLLPIDAPAPFRANAAKIPLGAAPLCGTTRVLDRDTLMHHMGIGHDLLSQLVVPERVVVSCSLRPITLEEVAAAIKGELESKGTVVAGPSVDQLMFQSQVFAKPGDAALRVIRSDFDGPLRRAKFLLTSSGNSNALPFVVTALLGPDASLTHAQHAAELKSQSALSQTITPAPKAEILVEAGRRARLALRSASIEMVEDVLPLEPGVLGQQIRVRMLDTGKVSKARVDGRSHLEVSF